MQESKNRTILELKMKSLLAFVPLLVTVGAANFWDPPRGAPFPPLAIWNLDPRCNTCRDVVTSQETHQDGFHCSHPAGQLADCVACCNEKTLHLGLMWPQPVTGFNIISPIDNEPACACCFSNNQCQEPPRPQPPQQQQPLPRPQPVPVPIPPMPQPFPQGPHMQQRRRR